MRKNLAKHAGYRGEFSGTFARTGLKPAYKGPPLVTVLLSDIVFWPSNEEACDHLWLNDTKGFHALAAQPGDTVVFRARIVPYVKGYRGRREDAWDAPPVEKDYKLAFPTAFRLLRQAAQQLALEPPPADTHAADEGRM